jgi:Tfp pilus assembly protein PilO
LLITVLVLVLVVGIYLLTADYLKQHRENKTLVSRIDEMAQVLAQVPLPPTDLEERLNAARSALEATQNSLPDQLNTTRTIDFILKLAEATGVKAIPLVTQPWGTEKVGDYEYAVFRVDISANGTYTNLANFINQLETGELKTLIIKSLSIERVPDEPADAGTMPVEARLAIAVYVRPAAGGETVKAT